MAKRTWPKTARELFDAGYTFIRMGACKGCQKTVEWWLTPKAKWMPLENIMGLDTLQPHWGTCPKADQFRNKQHEKTN